MWGVIIGFSLVLVYLILGLEKVKDKMAANKDELRNFANSFNAAIDDVVKVINELKADDEDVTVEEIKEALQGPLDRLKELAGPVIEPPVPSAKPSRKF